MNARNLAGLSVLLVAAAASWYLSSSLRQPPAAERQRAPLQQGYYLKAARILGTGESGRLLYEIEADYAEQRADDKIAFEKVRIRYSPAADVPWLLSADAAIITGNQQKLTLTGHVVAVSESGVDNNATEIRTDSLELEPENYLARTDDRVQIRIGERSITATGMEALLREDRLKLYSNVSGKFVP